MKKFTRVFCPKTDQMSYFHHRQWKYLEICKKTYIQLNKHKFAGQGQGNAIVTSFSHPCGFKIEYSLTFFYYRVKTWLFVKDKFRQIWKHKKYNQSLTMTCILKLYYEKRISQELAHVNHEFHFQEFDFKLTLICAKTEIHLHRCLQTQMQWMTKSWSISDLLSTPIILANTSSRCEL